MSDRWTEHGFTMGAAEVTRLASIDGYAVIGVATKHKRIEIIVTPKGHKIKVTEYPPVDHFITQSGGGVDGNTGQT